MSRSPSLQSTRASNPWLDSLRRLNKNRAAVLAALFLFVITLVCLLLPLTPLLVDPNDTELYNRNLPPGSSAPLADQEHRYLLGSDHLGRDILSRTVYGGRISLTVGILTALFSVTIGTIYGAIAGYAGGKTNALMMRAVDILYALPFLVIVILVSTALTDPSQALTDWVVARFESLFDSDFIAEANIAPLMNLLPLFLAIGALSWLSTSRIIMASVQSQRKLEYVLAARSMGLSHSRILFTQILPNVLGPIIVYTTLTIPSIMLFEASLSFLGVGVKPPNASWGSLIKEGAENMLTAPHLLITPSICFVLTLLSLNFFGDGLRDALDVRSAKD